MKPKSPARNLLPDMRALGQNDALFRSAIEHMPLGVSMFDHEDRLIISNKRYQQIYGHPDSLMRPGTPFKDIIAKTPGTEIKERDESAIGTERQLRYNPDDPVVVREWLLDDGRQIEITISRITDGACVALHEDVTQQRKALESLVYMARHDPLTGLLNRGRLLSLLNEALGAERLKSPIALLEIDLDGFKSVNDTMGHAAGDQLLCNVAHRLKFSVLCDICVARLGGDEFALFGSLDKLHCTPEAFGKRIIAELKKPYCINKSPVQIGASIGIGIAPNHGKSADALMHSADIALYRAKRDGRSCAREFSSEMITTPDLRRSA